MATIIYLPSPLKFENNHVGEKPNWALWAGSSIALGILSYYAPKTFLAISVGIFAYQVYRFNQLAHTTDDPQQIRAWAINACLVMCSVGTVFGIKSLPHFWSAAKDLRHLQLIHCVGHLAKGVIMASVAWSLTRFKKSAEDLASHRRWVEMEDYVVNYPVEIKQRFLPKYLAQLVFYIFALPPQTRIAKFFSKHPLISQFQPEETKSLILKGFFEKMSEDEWPFAIHQFQQLSTGDQLAIAPKLAARASRFSEEEQNRFPDDIKAIILNEMLRSFTEIPTHQESNSKWQTFYSDFEKLPREQQSILGEEFLRLMNGTWLGCRSSVFSEGMRLAALKAWTRDANKWKFKSLADRIFDGLTDSFKTEFGLFLQGLLKDNIIRRLLSKAMEDALPRAS